MHTQPCLVKLREVLKLREDWIWRQARQQPAEEVEEEEEKVEEEEEKVRLRACILYPEFQAIRMQTVHV